jgi:hypothetical protein
MKKKRIKEYEENREKNKVYKDIHIYTYIPW